MEVSKLTRTLGVMTSSLGGWSERSPERGFYVYNFPSTWVRILVQRTESGDVLTVHTGAMGMLILAKVEDIESFTWSKKEGSYTIRIKDCAAFISGLLTKQKEEHGDNSGVAEGSK